MRPVNLIPPEERRGQGAAKGTGVLAYAIVGVLAVAVVVVAATTYFGNQISEREAEVASVQSEVDAAQTRAASLTSFTNLQSVRDARVLTIDSLAKSRFDWERVLQELARIIPERVAITNVTGTVTPAVTVDGEAAVAFRDTVPGPALEILGCARGQRDVAGFIASLHDIDGVGRVTATEGIRGKAEEEDGATSAPAGGCAHPGDSVFQIVAAFDAVPVPAGAVPTDPAAAPTATATSTTTSTDPAAAGTESPASQEATDAANTDTAQAEINNAKSKADDATNIVPGG